MNSLTDLLEMVKAAEGPSRELDARIAAAFRYFLDLDKHVEKLFDKNPELEAGEDGSITVWAVGGDGKTHKALKQKSIAVTSSIDAALELVERELSTYSLRLTIDPSGNGANLTWWPRGLSNSEEFEITTEGVSASLCLAILYALISAKIEKAG